VTLLLTIHSITRWILTLVAMALITRLAFGLTKKQPFDQTARGLTTAFAGLMDTQMLLGALYFLVSGLGGTGFPTYRWEHALTMLTAVVVAHLPSLWKKAEDNVRTRNTLIAVSASLIIILIGVLPLGGWTRWWHITGIL